MIARYNHLQPFDEYAGHRAVQAFTFSQFVKHTSVSCDAVIVMGDFNTAATETPYRILRSNAVLNDAWLVKNGECADGEGCTSDALHNCFRTNYSSGILPHGERIDYIMYRANERIDLQLFECRVIKDKIPGTNLDYSDHQPVVARMSIKKNITAGQVPMPDSDVRLSCLQELIDTVDKGSARARYSKYFYFVMSLICLMMLLVSRERYLGDFGDTFHTILEIIQLHLIVSKRAALWPSWRLLAYGCLPSPPDGKNEYTGGRSVTLKFWLKGQSQQRSKSLTKHTEIRRKPTLYVTGR
ncbi:SMPD2 [Bugula neritina]|uniref:SMPD2 n=1 Tax=Bugula neritina TaxID=10212 RepID=A0A7J7K5Y1_BUGNE|nr:SMPD2 [Bugula neritina]